MTKHVLTREKAELLNTVFVVAKHRRYCAQKHYELTPAALEWLGLANNESVATLTTGGNNGNK